MFCRYSCILAFVLAPAAVSAQGPANYPVAPRPLGEAEEIALALRAAPDEVSSRSDVYVLRGTDLVKVRTGTTGGACMVSRDSHEQSRYPICYDREGARSSFLREKMQVELRAKGFTEDAIKRDVKAAYANGTLRMPAQITVAYMMSPSQVLFSSPNADGVRVGAWWPHIMIQAPSGVSAEEFGLLAKNSKVDVLSLDAAGEGHHPELTIKVPAWSNGQAVVPRTKP